MTKLTVKPDLKNDTRKEFLKDLNKAFATGDAGFIIRHATDDIRWIIYGDKVIVGKEQFTEQLNMMKDYTADELVIHSMITSNDEAAVNGEMKMNGKTYAFCDVYRFAGGGNMIRQMDSYVLSI
jgi:hypothetical protein